MCGICGFWSDSVNDDYQTVIQRMAESIRHRGRDICGLHVENSFGFGHQRLSILDLDSRANQPMISSNQRYLIVFNGEIYNYRELKNRIADVELRTTSDTEVLLELWAREGENCLSSLNGMFAFAVFDRLERTISCVRDRLGVKPFYFWHDERNFVFGSEAKAILQHPNYKKSVNFQAISDYLSLGYITGTSTAFEGINKLEPASVMVFKDGRLFSRKYWRLEDNVCSNGSSSPGRFLELLDSAVNYRLISDVPVGSFLSGGIDSSAVTALAAAKNSDIRTFTIGFKEKSYDESRAASEFADSLGLPNETTFFHEPDPEYLMHIVRYFDQPFADTSTLPFFQLCADSSSRIMTVLCGDGGDEIFAGYETRRADLAAVTGFRSIPFWSALMRAGSSVMSLIPADRGKVSLHYKLRQFFANAHLPPAQSHYSWRLLFSEEEKKMLFNQKIVESLSEHQTWNRFSEVFSSLESLPVLQQLAIADIKTWLVDDILYKADQSSMAHALEIRAPFLDYRLVEAAFSIPENKKFSIFQTKTLLRNELASILPAEVLRRKKEGFGSPVSVWFDGRLSSFFVELIHQNSFKEIFPDTGIILKLLDEHRTRRRDNGYRLWALLMLALWQKQWIKT